MEFLDAIGWTSKANDLERVFAGQEGCQVVPEQNGEAATYDMGQESDVDWKVMRSPWMGGRKNEMKMIILDLCRMHQGITREVGKGR